MPRVLSNLAEDARLAALNVADYAADMVDPSLRLGVTGLSRAGKTVFITALVHNLTAGGRLPLFSAFSDGRIARARLRPQPDDTVPRFDFETHRNALLGRNRDWPESTRAIGELRVTLDFESNSLLARTFRGGRLNLDIVDYPGEWLLDLSLLKLSYAQWSAKAIAQSRETSRHGLADAFHAHLQTADANGPEDESFARKASGLFTDYLRACRDERYALSALPPGRFLMPGDLEGSPALTFAPLDVTPDQHAPRGSLHAMMARRYEAYKSAVVRPFFRDHFARLDRQIVLVDVLQALNAGPGALNDLEAALGDILSAFRPGANSILSRLIGRRIERILFAATKADHLHQRNHGRLEALMRLLTERAIQRAESTGATVDAVALASLRATREGRITRGGQSMDCIIGTPQKGQTIGGETFDGKTEAALFPGDLPDDPQDVLRDPDHAFSAPKGMSEAESADFRFLRFRPPDLGASRKDAQRATMPHIRLDRTLEFLLGDRLA